MSVYFFSTVIRISMPGPNRRSPRLTTRSSSAGSPYATTGRPRPSSRSSAARARHPPASSARRGRTTDGSVPRMQLAPAVRQAAARGPRARPGIPETNGRRNPPAASRQRHPPARGPAADPPIVIDSSDDSDYSERDHWVSSGDSSSEMGSEVSLVSEPSSAPVHFPFQLGYQYFPQAFNSFWRFAVGGGLDEPYDSEEDEDYSDDAIRSQSEIMTSDDDEDDGPPPPEGGLLAFSEFSISSKLTNVDKLPVDQRTCLVCHDEFKEGQITRRLNCCHMFHQECVDRWLERHPSCPICKHCFTREGMERDEHDLTRRSEAASRATPASAAPPASRRSRR
uniref:RING-type domain-containing protein n=1 Tax=Eutreptiella gymnastica TaxID=73025 RepID=A0A7S4GHF4_9EUGL